MKCRRQPLLTTLAQLASRALFGTLSESYRTCGQPGCHCHRGQKHGPHFYMSYRGPEGKTTGYYVPAGLVERVQQGVEAWHELETVLRQLAEENRQRLFERKPKKRFRRPR